jgi:hypothetical protein
MLSKRKRAPPPGRGSFSELVVAHTPDVGKVGICAARMTHPQVIVPNRGASRLVSQGSAL